MCCLNVFHNNKYKNKCISTFTYSLTEIKMNFTIDIQQFPLLIKNSRYMVLTSFFIVFYLIINPNYLKSLCTFLHPGLSSYLHICVTTPMTDIPLFLFYFYSIKQRLRQLWHLSVSKQEVLYFTDSYSILPF